MRTIGGYVSGRITWRLTPDQLCHLDLMAAGHLDPLVSFMPPAGVDEVRATGELLGCAWPFPLPLTVDASAVPPDADALALVDPEGVELATVIGLSVQPSDVPGHLTAWGRTSHRTRVEPADFPALYLNSSELRAVATGATALVTYLPPTAAVEAALDAHLRREGAALIVLVAVGADLGDRAHSTVLAWQSALEGRPRVRLVLLKTGEDLEQGLPLAVVAADVAGCTALAVSATWRDRGSREAHLAAFATRRGLEVIELRVAALAPADLATSGACTYRDVYGDAAWPHVARAYPPPSEQGVTVMFTGLSGAGKSTIASAVAARLRAVGPRRVTLLDGDVVRTNLTSGLGFSAEDRRTNVMRIAWVAAQVTRHGGIAVCAPIAPYAALRSEARRTVEVQGTFVLVYVATSLEECERRDRKGLYAKARRGEVLSFTGISDPYEAPTDADITLDTVHTPVDDAVEEVLAHLRWRGLLAAG